MELKDIKAKVVANVAKRDALKEQSDTLFKQFKAETKRAENAEKALVVMQEVAVATQKALDSYISNMVTMALKAVNPEWPEFKVETISRNNQSEMDMCFLISGEPTGLKESDGGGPLDVAAFTLKVVSWTLNKNRPTFLLDEPFKFVSPDLQDKVSSMLRLMHNKLKMQIIMVSHAENINVAADKTFIVEKKGGISNVRTEI